MDTVNILKQSGITAADLSKKTGIPAARIYKWYDGTAKPKLEDRKKIELFLQQTAGPRDKNTDVQKAIESLRRDVIKIKAELIVITPMLDYLYSKDYNKPISIIAAERRQAVSLEVDRLLSEANKIG